MQRTVHLAFINCLFFAVLPVNLARAQNGQTAEVKHASRSALPLIAGRTASDSFTPHAGEDNSKSGERSDDYEQAMSVKYLTLQDGVDPKEAREFMETEYLRVYNELPGFNVKVGQPDPARIGDSDPDFVMIYIFDSKWTRDHYFPEPGVWSDEVHGAIEKNRETFEKLFGVYFIESEYESHEYIMFARAK